MNIGIGDLIMWLSPWLLFGFQRILYDTCDENNGFKIMEVLLTFAPLIGIVAQIVYWLYRNDQYACDSHYLYIGKHLKRNAISYFIYNRTLEIADRNKALFS